MNATSAKENIFIGIAHGRVNIIGEHTDYNSGFVLPTLIPQACQIRLKVRADKTVVLSSSNLGSSRAQTYQLGSEAVTGEWIDYIQGVTSVLQKRGIRIGGFEAALDSRVPIGSGLSSSAALEIALLRALNQAFQLNLDPVVMAKIGQQAENDFVGARVGIMDQMAASLARLGEALLIDTRDLTCSHIPLPLDKMDIVIIHSGVSHRLAGSEYNKRRKECESACEILGIKSLRELSVAKLTESMPLLAEPLASRVRHVVTENDRVLKVLDALRNGDLQSVGALLNLSHLSLRDDYQVSVAEVDALVDIAQHHKDVFGARITGGGFGGSVIILAHAGRGALVAEEVFSAYLKKYPSVHAAILMPEQGEKSASDSSATL